MEENLNNNQKSKKQEPKKKKIKIVVIILSIIVVVLLGLQIYAATNGYGNVFSMINDWTTTKNEAGEDEALLEGNIDKNENNSNTSTNENQLEPDNYAEEVMKYEKDTDGYLGTWSVKKALNGAKEISLQEIYGTSIKYGVGNLILSEDKTFKDQIAPIYESEDSRAGTYKVNGSQITLTYNSGDERYLTYNNNTINYIVYDDYNLIMEKNTNTTNMSTQLEPDNYAEMVEIDDAYDKFIEKLPKTKTFKTTRIDIDNDGVHELIVAKGDFEAEKEVSFYTYKNGEVIDLGTLGFGHSLLYKMNNENYLLQVYGQMGSEQLSKVYIKEGKIQRDLISSREVPQNEDYAEGDILLQELVY